MKEGWTTIMSIVSFQVLFLGLLYCSCSSTVVSDDSEGYLIELTDTTFDDAVAKPDFMIIEFYSTWCVHCQNLLPMFEEVAKILKEDHNVTFAKINIEIEKKTQAKYQISVLPGIRIFRRGVIFDYEGPGEKEGSDGLLKYFLQEKGKTDLVDNPIIVLTNDNYDEITQNAELILVEFFVKECLPCAQMEPHFAAASRRLAKNDPPVLLGTVNVADNIDLSKRFGLQQYPYLVVIRHGEMYNYTGPKEEDGIVKYMGREAGPSSVFLESVDEARTFSRSDTEPHGIGFFSSETSAAALKNFMRSGNEARKDLRLGHTTDQAIAEKLSFPLNSVVIFHPQLLVSKYETGYTIIPDVDEGETPKSLLLAYQKALRPLVGQMDKDNHIRAYKYRPLLVAYYEIAWDHEFRIDTQYWHSLIADVALRYKDSDLSFAIANEQDFPTDLRALGFESWGEDVAVGLYAPGPRKYRLTEELTKDSLTEFIEDFLSGDLKPYYSSEIPPKKGAGPVRTIVGSTFNKIVYDSKVNVVVMLCIPSLQQCGAATEWFLKAATKFYKKDKSVVFGTVNVELNDISLEHFKFDDLPTLFFSPKGSKSEMDLRRIDPVPSDEIDLLGWLRSKAKIQVSRDEL